MSLKRLAFAFQAAVTVALLALLFRKFDWAVFQSAFTRTPPWFYVASFGVLVAGQALYVFKWGLVLGAMGFEPEIPGNIAETKPPTSKQLALIRETIDPRRLLLAHEPRSAAKAGRA